MKDPEDEIIEDSTTIWGNPDVDPWTGKDLDDDSDE